MHKGLVGMALVASIGTSTLAEARTRLVLQPVQLANENVRFDRGDYVVDQAGPSASVQIRSAPADHDNTSFFIAVMNSGRDPINVDVSNVRVEGAGGTVRLLPKAEMIRKAERRAGRQKFFTALAGSLAAAGQASARNTYSATTFTPYGSVTTHISAPCYSCQAAAGDTLALTGARIDQIRSALDNTRDALHDQALQLTTVYPGQSYGGRIFLSPYKAEMGSEMRLVVSVGRESFTFAFRLAAEGAAMPSYRMTNVPMPMQAPVAAPAVAPAPPAPAPVVYAAQPIVGRSPAMPVGRVMPVATPVSTGASVAVRGRWQRYYSGLVESGVPRAEARNMADEEFGAID